MGAIEKVDVIRDLGVLIKADFGFRIRYLEAAENVNRALSQLQRTIGSKKQGLSSSLYGAFVGLYLVYVIHV